jgi:hypothetical protein
MHSTSGSSEQSLVRLEAHSSKSLQITPFPGIKSVNLKFLLKFSRNSAFLIDIKPDLPGAKKKKVVFM